MSEHIAEISWADFVKIGNAGKIGDLLSCEVKAGEDVFTVIIRHGDMFSRDYAELQSARIAIRTNIVGGRPVADLLAEIESETKPVDPYPHLTKAREMRAAKKNARAAGIKERELVNA